MAYTRIDIVGGKECRVEFETLREAVREPPVSNDSSIEDGDRLVAFSWTEPLEWVPNSDTYGDEVEALVLAPARRLRARLAEALGLTNPSDDELVEAVSRAASRELTTEMAKHINSNPPPPHLSGAPLPEGREGESIVVVAWDGSSSVYTWCPYDTPRGGRWESRGARNLWAGQHRYHWAYVTRVGE